MTSKRHLALILLWTASTVIPATGVSVIDSDSPDANSESQWIDRLQYGSPEQREQAAIEPPEPLPASAIGALLETLDDVQVEVRLAAIYSLTAIGDPVVVGRMKEFLSSPLPKIREAATWALLKLGDRTSNTKIRTLLSDEDGAVRTAAAWYLGESEDTRDVDALIQATSDPDFRVREATAYGLGKQGHARSFDVIVPMLGDQKATVRKAACWSLSNAGVGKYWDPLRKRLADPEMPVRLAAAGALQRLGDDSGQLAEDAMNGSNKAIRALGRKSEVTLLPFFAMLIHSDQAAIRRATARALGDGGLEESESILKQYRSSMNLRDRMTAAQAISRLKNSAFLAAMTSQFFTLMTWPFSLFAIALLLIALGIKRRRRPDI